MRFPCSARPFRASRRSLLALLGLVALLAAGAPSQARRSGPKRRSENVVLVLLDGMRWQEVFGGADQRLMDKESGGVANAAELKKRYWRSTAEERRATLMPFLWGTLAKQGQLYGNRDKGSAARVTNTMHFSYPGYSEMIVGYPDPRIDSNDKRPNPNVSVFEWLNRKPAFQGKVAAFGAWDVVPYIVNRERCGFYVNGAFEPVTVGKISPEQALLNRLKSEMTQPWAGEPYDAITFHSALEYLKANRPRAMWLTFGETDEWAHERSYAHYLDAARQTDAHLETLWKTLQSHPQYRGRTTLILCVDHGRGRTGKDWTSHGAKIPGADEIWMAALGPDTPALGERTNTATVTQSQIAATVAAAVGEDYRAAVPQAGAVLAEAFRRD
jgi:arylsulfatase A-like enzyme